MQRKKRLYTEQDIRDLVLSQKVRVLHVEPGDIVTPLGRDAARAFGLNIVTVPAGLASTAAPAPGRSESSGPLSPGNGIKRVEGRDFRIPPFPVNLNRPEMDVRCGDVITSADGAPMAAGFLSLQKGSFPWTLDYHEIQYVLEGELHIGTRDGTLVGKPGDIFYIPQGTSITFGTPSWAKFFYVTYPADWAGG